MNHINQLGTRRIIFLMIFIGFSSVLAFGQYRSLDQYRMEIGLMGGSSFYIGDANPTTPFHRAGLAWGGLFRYNLNPRYTLKASVMRAEVSGDTRDFDNKYPKDAHAKFQRDFWDVGLNLEFNFMDYGLPDYVHGSHWFSPYIFVGAGFTSFMDKMNDVARVEFNLPFGVGVKFKFADRFNFGAEWSMHALLIDDFDVTDENSKLLDNPYGFQGISKMKENDRYSIAKVFVSADLFKRKHCK